MRILSFLTLAAMVAVMAPSAQAGVFGSSLFTVSSMKVERSAGTQAGGPTGGFSVVGAGAITLNVTGIDTLNEAEILGIPAVQIGGGPDPLQAFVTSGAEAAGGENDFTRRTPLPATSAFARADQQTTGSLLDTVNGLTTRMVAEMEAADTSLGSAGAGSTGFSTFAINVNQNGWYRLAFDASIDMLVSSIGPPAMRTAFATSNLSIQINGLTVTLDDPGLVSNSISGNGALTLTSTNVVTGSVFLRVQTAPHILTITQQTTAGVAAIPEPGSMLAFAGIVVAGGVSRLRRRRAV